MTRSTGCAAAAWWYLLVIAGLIAPSIPQLIPYGTQQFFQYENKISVTDLRNTKAKDISSFTLTATVTVRSIWDQGATQLLLITVHKPKVKTPGDVQKVPKILDKPFYVVLDDGRVSEVLADRSRDAYLLNMRRSIASLLNFRLEDGPVPEVDVSGECIAFYTAKSSTRFEKIKSDCSNWDLKVRYRSEIPLGIEMKPSLKVEYQLAQDASLLKVRSRETHSVALHAKPDAGSKVESVVTLKHVSGSSVEQVKFDSLNDTISSLENFRPYELQAEVDGAVSEIKGMTFTAQVAADKKELADANIGKEAAALLLVKLLPIARITKAEEFVQTFKKHKSITSQLIDLMGATQTIDAHSAIFELFETENKKNFDNLERYLQALAVGTHPDKAIIEDLLERIESGKVKNAKLLDTLIQTTASLVRQSTLGQADKLASQVKKYILIQLVNKCETAECKTQYIRALQNLQFPSTTPTLMKLAAQGQSKVSVAALQALNSFSNKVFCDEDRKQFESIFYQTNRRHDSSARVLALDIILGMKPTKEQLGRLVDYLGSNDSQFEMKAYVLQKLRMASEKCSRFSDLLRAVLAERPHINNYHVMAQRGLTTALQRELSHAPAFNETIISIQEINSGILKRGSVEMILKAGREEISTFRLGIYTSGLTSFIGDSGSDEEPEEEDNSVTAGMEIAIQGILLRPLIFFNGQSELMGHVWSGTAADPIPAFLATTLVQDHEHYVILSSGATVYLRVFGARSIDLNGKVDFSLWNRNAHAEIKQSSGTGVVGSMIVGTSFARLENTFTLTNEPKISFIADIDFYSDIKLCIQLGRPETELWQKHEKSVTLTNEWRYTKKVTSKIGHKLPAVTYALNQKNNEMCNMIFS